MVVNTALVARKSPVGRLLMVGSLPNIDAVVLPKDPITDDER